MNNHDQLESLPLDDLERIDAACDALASAWKRGVNPSIDEIVQAAAESLRPLLVAELVRTEIELRLSAGERPNVDDYVSRFPQWAAELHAVLAQSLTTPDVASSSTMAPTVQLSVKDTADDVPLMALSKSTAAYASMVVGLDESVIQALRSRYEIRGVLGRGGMGIVVKARDTKLDREVALKLLAPELARDETAKQRFLREARAAAAVKHDNVVTIYSADEINDVPLLEMELIEGESLAERIKRDGALPADEVARFAIQIAQGLDAAHRRGLIHRDIKPANILLEKIDSIVSRSASAPGLRDAADSPGADATRLASGSFSRVKITDFGLARVTADVAITHSGLIAGTPQYMSPEQAEAKPLDHRTDLFSLGSVMYSMCTGQSAFQAETALVTLRLVSDSTPPTIREINPGVPTWLVSIIERLMAKNPDDRFQSAAEVAEALTRAASSPTQASIATDRASARTTAGTNLLKWSWLVSAVVIVVAIVVVVQRNQPVTPQGDFHALGERGYDKRGDGAHSDVDIGKNRTEEISDADTKPPSTIHRLVSSEFEWTEPENLGPNINTESSEDHACVSGDALQLIFVRRQNGAADLWSSVRTNPSEKWGVAQRMPDGINSLQQDQTPFMSADGLSLWFASDRSGGSGKSDLYVSQRETPDGEFEPAIPLSAPVNTSDDEASPFVSADGLTLLFGRGVPRQLFQATRPNLDASFGTPKVLANVNSGQWQEFPRLTLDGLHLLFVGSTNGFNSQGLVIASRNRITDDFSPPKSLGSMFHVGVVSGPSLSSDESTIYFSAKRGGLNHHDLWVTRRVPKGSTVREVRVTDADGKPLPAVAPFRPEQAREFQNVWAKHLNVDVQTANSIGMKLSLIPPGEFLMGATDDDRDAQPQEKPPHNVRLTKPFFLGTTEVTVGQFRRFVEATNYVTQAESDGQGAFDVSQKIRRRNYVWSKLSEVGQVSSDEHPVRCVSWEDARQFCEWLSKTEGRVYRLPTDAEWEFACRAGTQARYSFGNDFDEASANSARSGVGSQLQAVAQFPANPFGLFDMHGNLNEICWDSGRTFTADPVTDPLGSIELSTPAVVRGGALSSSPARLRSSQRYLSDARRFPEDNFATLVKGFRVSTSLESAMPQTKMVAQARRPTLEFGEQLLSVKNAAGLKLGDLDGDGDLDLFVATLKAPCVVLRNDGRGHFTDSGQQLGDNASFAVALGDLDGDGDLDAYVCNSDDQKDAIWLNDGHGTFQRSPQSFPPGRSNDVSLADIDGDKDLDIVVSDFGGPATIWINDKSGRFTSQQTIERRKNTGVALGDLDGDGDADLVMTSFDGDNRVWFNDSQGHFTDSDQPIELAESTSVALGDLDRDGHLDLFITAHDGSQVWFNNGKGHFQASEQRLGDSFCEAVELLDLDADHDLDAVSIGGGFEIPKPGTVWRNDGKGRFAKVATTLKTGRTQALTVGDLDGDGDPDVVLGNLAEPAEVWLNPSNQSTIP